MNGEAGGSWHTLIAIREEARQEARMRDQQPPQACPHDGQPLRPGRRGGELYCPWGDFHWPRDKHAAVR